MEHNKLLIKVAKEQLCPFGIFQKGKSRTFLQDQGWYTNIIEFQPSGFDKGTHLNVAADFHFYPRDYFALTFGGRIENFIPFQNPEQYSKAISQFCTSAIKKISHINQELKNLSTAEKTLKSVFDSDDDWHNYDRAIIYGLNGKTSQAQELLRKVISAKGDYEWLIQRKEFCLQLLNWLDTQGFREMILETILRTRALKKLPLFGKENLIEDK